MRSRLKKLERLPCSCGVDTNEDNCRSKEYVLCYCMINPNHVID